MVDGKCIDENKVVEDAKACINYKCISKVKNEEVCSDYVMIGKGLYTYMLNVGINS